MKCCFLAPFIPDKSYQKYIKLEIYLFTLILRHFSSFAKYQVFMQSSNFEEYDEMDEVMTNFLNFIIMTLLRMFNGVQG